MLFLARIAIAALALAPLAAHAQANWPSQPIKLIVPYAPGSSGDISARKVAPLIAQKFKDANVIVENRLGASGMIGMEAVANATDGHTFLIASDIQSAVYPLLRKANQVDFDKALKPVGPLVFVEMMVAANMDFPAKNLAEMITMAKAKPGAISYGSTGIGSSHQLIMEHLKLTGGFDVLHVPYKSSPAALPDLVGGQIQVMFMALSTGLSNINSGKLKALAVGAPQRNPRLPDVPTLAESGFPGLEFYSYWSVWAPSATPEPVLASLRDALTEATNSKDVVDWFGSVGLTPFKGGMPRLMEVTKSDRDKWQKVITVNKIELKD